MAFGDLLRELRERAGLSQAELAERAALSSHAVSALERGARTRPYPHTIRSLAEALGASEEERAALVASVPSRRAPVSPPTSPHPGSPVPAPSTAGPPDLPSSTTPLLGREPEVHRIATLLRRERLVTLTGIGGVGKTRLALAACRAVTDHVASDGVCFVELAPVPDAGAVLPTVADALLAGKPTGPDPLAAVAAAVRGRRLLLVLDNLEHLLEAAADVAALLRACPDLTVLATSRAPLRIRGEHEVPVEPLALPHAGAPAESPAVRLLLARARAVSPGWGGSPDGSPDPAVADICVRLAGVPLALELAAARARLLAPDALLARLDDSLTGGARDLPARQRTMRATLDWSYRLLDAEAQGLLRLLAVFVGGFRLEDAEGVAARTGRAAAATTAGLEVLLEHSLLRRDTAGEATGRLRLLEPVQQYARERLDAAGEAQAAEAAHLEHFLALAQEAAPHYQDEQQVPWLARIDAEHANLGAAADRGLAAGRADQVGELVWALWMYWWMRGHHAHGRRLAEAVLAADPPPAVRQGAALAAATTSFAMDDVAASRHWWSAAEHAGDDPLMRANAVAGIGLADLAVGDLAAARSRFEVAVPLAEGCGARGDWLAALTRIWTGTVALLQGDPDTAVALIHDGLASARRRGDRLTIYVALYNLCQLELARGGHGAARGHLEEGMRLSLETGDLANLAYVLDAMAVLEAAESVHARVPILLGAAQAIREQGGARGYHYYRPDPDAAAAAAAQARRHLGGDRYDDALDVGLRMGPAEAVAVALRERPLTG